MAATSVPPLGGLSISSCPPVSDDGCEIDDPLAGFLPPRPGHADGAGLWVARQLTRQLELVLSPQGATVRLWV